MKFVRRVGLVLLLCLAIFAPMANGSGAPKATISVTATPASNSTVNGGSASFSVSVVTSNVSGTVSLSASGLPLLATANFGPASFNASATPSRTVNLTVSTSALTPFGNSTITIQAAGGGVAATTTVNLAVCTFKITSVSPSSVKISAGATASYAITIARCPGYTSAPLLTVTGLPLLATASFVPNPVTGTTSSLVVNTSTATPSGSYTLTIGGIGAVSATAALSIDASTGGGGKTPFTISGNLSGLLAPGVTRPLDLTLTNPNNQDLTVNSLVVTISSTSKPTCSTNNYAVTQFSGNYSTLVIPHNSSRSLSSLGVTTAQLPKVGMLNLSSNQDACKSAVLTLNYTGTGSGN